MSNLDVYGPIADQAATANGIDPTVFRNLIMSESSFNPTAINPQSVNGENASGIAQFLPSTAASLGINPFDPISSLNGAASYLSGLVSKYGLSGGIAAYKGYSNINSPAAQSAAAGVIGNSGASTSTPDAPTINTPNLDGFTGGEQLGQQLATPDATLKAKADSNKSLWQYTSADWKALFQNSAFGFIFGFFGIAIVLLSIYMVAKSSGTNSMGAVKSIAGA